MKHALLRRYGVAVVLAAAALSACTSGEEARESVVPINVVRITSDSQAMTPAVALLPDESQRRSILLAHDTLLAECLSAKGDVLSLNIGDRLPWVQDLTSPFAGKAPFGPVDPDRMARFGYHDPRHSPDLAPDSEWGGEPTPTALVRSCDDEVTKGLGGTPPYDLKKLIVDAAKQAGTDPRRQAPIKAWSACMKEKGYNYRSGGDPWGDFAMSPEAMGAKVTAKEIAVATADADCQARARNVDTHIALIVAYQKQALVEHADEVSEYRSYLDALLRRSAEIVTEKPAPQNRREVGNAS
ncbi:hypothetical protein ABFU82_17230 [Nocardioides sp. WV_118_6]